VVLHKVDPAILEKVLGTSTEEIRSAIVNPDKASRESGLTELKNEIVARLAPEYPEREGDLGEAVEKAIKMQIRHLVLEEGNVRTGARRMRSGRLPARSASCRARTGRASSPAARRRSSRSPRWAALPRTADRWLARKRASGTCIITIPPFSVGETRPMRGPGRREIGHGALAERALIRMIPPMEEFPYVVRLVSETLESNGSSSMAASAAARWR